MKTAINDASLAMARAARYQKKLEYYTKRLNEMAEEREGVPKPKRQFRVE